MAKIAFLFPGQGSQSIGMGKSLYDANEIAKAVFDRASGVSSIDIRELCFEGTEEDLKKTENTQPALLTTSIACYEVLKSRGIKGSHFAGHSLGEITALTAAGFISFDDAIKITRERGLLMAKSGKENEFAMAAVLGLTFSQVSELLPQGVVIANHNSLEQVVISGRTEAVAEVTPKLTDAGAKRVLPLKVSSAFHSPFMSDAADAFKIFLDDFTFYQSDNIVMSNVTAEPHSFEEIKNLLFLQMKNTVKWYDTMSKFENIGITHAYECGPGKVLTGLMKKALPNIETLPIYDEDTLSKVVSN